ncbi:MAG: hypothetical protein OXH31_03475 [Gammaproteobacteria bacterium]|nr:hypothetical protein [Gammaproteobacteria bacterium]
MNNATSGKTRTLPSAGISIIVIGLSIGIAVGVVAYAITTCVLNSSDGQGGTSSSMTSFSRTNDAARDDDLKGFDWIFSNEVNDSELHALSESLRSLTEQDLIHLLKKSSIQPASPQIYTIQEMLVEVLAESAPRLAVKNLTEFADYRRLALLCVIFTSWSATNLEEAILAATELPRYDRNFVISNIATVRNDLSSEAWSTLTDGLELNPEIVAQIRELEMYEMLDEDPARAFESLASDDIDDTEQIHLYQQIVEKWFESEGFDIIFDLDGTNLSGGLQTELVKYIAGRDREAVLELLSRNVELTRMTTINYNFVQSWLEEDAEAAYQAVSNLPKSPFRSSMLSSLVNSWGRQDPNAVLERLMDLPRDKRSDALRAAVNELAKDNPKNALDRLLSFIATPGAMVEVALPNVIRIWSDDEPNQALEWVQSNAAEYSENRIELFRAVLPRFALVEPAQAMAIAVEEFNSDQSGWSLESTVMSSLLSADKIDAAIELLDQLRDEIRQTETVNVGAELAKDGRLDDVLTLSESVPEEEKPNYFYWVAARLTIYDSASDILEMISRIPSAEIQSEVVERMFSAGYGASEFTAEQIETLRSYLPE